MMLTGDGLSTVAVMVISTAAPASGRRYSTLASRRPGKLGKTAGEGGRGGGY
jgi:hypothetical protein